MKLERGKSYKYRNAYHNWDHAFFISLKNCEIREFTYYLIFNISTLRVERALLFGSEIFYLSLNKDK